MWAVIIQLLGNVVYADEPEPVPADNTRGEAALDTLLADTPHINKLLIDREFQLIGGKWGWDVFIDAPLNSEPEGAEITLRRAKAWYARRFGEDWRLKLTANYSRGGGLELSDNFFTYSGWDRTRILIGISDPAFSLESVSSSAGLTFMERGLVVAALSESKSANIGFLRRNTNSILNASLTLFNVSQDDLREDGQGIVLHYVHSPITIGRADSIHVGGSFSYRWNASEKNTRFRSRPEVATVNEFYVDTGEIAGADRIGRLGLEASQVAGRFSWQMEVIAARVQRNSLHAAEFWGAYAFASWFLTDDSRNYDFGDGSFGKVQVNQPIRGEGWGAFELAFRASYLDLNGGDIIGGRQKNLSAGINWYLNQRWRLMANVVKVLDVDRPGSKFDGADPLSVSLRIQWVLD
jgi:phosphate-selective porin OprO/OprP